jgi:hypothetical protein
MSGVPEEILSATLRTTLDLERITAARVAQQLAEARELLRQVAAEHRAMERTPFAQAHRLVAQAHAALAERIEAHLAQPAPTTTQRGA